MAPVQPGASVAATGLGIRYIGEHAYAYSGTIGISTSTQTLLEFTSGSGYIVAQVFCCGPVNPSDISSGSNSLFTIYFNDLLVAQNKLGTTAEGMPTYSDQTLVIPPNTIVRIDNIDVTNNAAFKIQAYIIGRIYGAE